MDDDFEGLVRSLLDEALPGVVDAVEAKAKAVHAQAVDRAPVKTGALRDAFRFEVLVAPDLSSIRGRVVNDAPHAKFVKSSKLPGSGSAFVELLRKPMEQAGEELVAEIRDVLERRVT
jgi:hypothetical protein